MALSLFNINPITLLVFVAVVNGIAAAPFLVVTMLVASDRGIMGDYANGKLAFALGGSLCFSWDRPPSRC